MTLTKADLAIAIYKKYDTMTMKEATKAVEAFLRLSKEALIEGPDLLLTNFGKFTVNTKRPRRGRNPQTGESLLLDTRRVVTFHPSGYLRRKVNE